MNASHARVRLLLVAALSAVGCGSGTHSVNDYCAPLASTGGDPMGNWEVTASCQVPYARTASDDWCSRLVYDNSGVHDGLFLGQDFSPGTGRSLKYQREA